MMGYRKMLHTGTKADSFENNNTITTYNVFTSNLGNERVSNNITPFFIGYNLNKTKHV